MLTRVGEEYDDVLAAVFILLREKDCGGKGSS